ncbi:hypothetical protein BDFG_08881, partial [Blastomyces dermatitidis ATCC 26199]
SSYIDRSVSADNSEPDITFLIENLKNMIIKKLSVLYMTESLISLLVSSAASFSVTSQSSTLISVSDSLTSATSVFITLTSVTSDFTVSAFIISSSHFKKILYRLDESYFSRITFSLNSIEIVKDICVFRNRNTDVVLFYICRCEAHTSFALILEIILIEDDNTAETIFSYSQASSITFSLSSVRKVVYTLSY